MGLRKTVRHTSHAKTLAELGYNKCSISAIVGMDAAAPGRVTDIAAAAQPRRTASTGPNPRASAVAKPPLNASPAPVVSVIGPTLKAGIWTCRSFVRSIAPCSPKVITTPPAPRSSNAPAGQRPGLCFIGRNIITQRKQFIVQGSSRGRIKNRHRPAATG